MSNIERGKAIARMIFRAGDMPHDKVKRIELKGGTWPDNETGLGGLCEEALAAVIATELDRLDDVAAVGKTATNNNGERT